MLLSLGHIRNTSHMPDGFRLPIIQPGTLRSWLDKWHGRAKLTSCGVKRIPLVFSLLKSKEFALLRYTLQLRTAAPQMASLSVFPGFG